MFSTVLMLLFISIPMYAFIRTLTSFKGKKEPKVKNKEGSVKIKTIDAYYSMIIYCLFWFGFYLNGIGMEAGERLRIYQLTGNKANGYASLANEHITTVIVLLTIGMISFWIISLNQGGLPPFIYVMCSTLIILNIIFAVVYLTHTGFSHDGEIFSVILLQISFLSLALLYCARLKDS